LREVDRWQVDFFARNVFDKDYLIFKQDVGAGPVARRGTPTIWVLPLVALSENSR
jgi:hypothetical protein